ncbi:MAG TPA: phosphoribosyltransferase family protein [Microlunatus sp.]|nr:phosphoribosyltransferase family protein [Microlunatus sp.]
MFTDRIDAGRQLAARLGSYAGEDVVVVGLPRGGVPVAAEVAAALNAPLDVIVVRKLGLPFQPELAMGAIGEDGVRVLDQSVLRLGRVTAPELRAVERRETAQLERRVSRLRRGRDRVDLRGRTVIVVDDGIATGSTARAACAVARHLGARRIVLAAPVAPPRVAETVPEADEVVTVATPTDFVAVGCHYEDFDPTTDEEVSVALDEATRRMAAAHASTPVSDPDLDVTVPVNDVVLEGHMHVPAPGAPMVVFAHGSGSSRHSPRNRYVAKVLNDAGIGTLLIDLLGESEEADRARVFDIPLLAGRLGSCVRWLVERPDTAMSPIGLFGASTGAAAALYATSDLGSLVSAVVSRGGRPDLAGARLGQVGVPTLLIVGGADSEVLALNRRSQAALAGVSELAVVPGAGHLFEEPGALATVARLARDWFVRYLQVPAVERPQVHAL